MQFLDAQSAHLSSFESFLERARPTVSWLEMQSYGPYPDAKSSLSLNQPHVLATAALGLGICYLSPTPHHSAATYSCLTSPTIELREAFSDYLSSTQSRNALIRARHTSPFNPPFAGGKPGEVRDFDASKLRPLTILQGFYRCFTAKRSEPGFSPGISQPCFIAAQSSHRQGLLHHKRDC